MGVLKISQGVPIHIGPQIDEAKKGTAKKGTDHFCDYFFARSPPFLRTLPVGLTHIHCEFSAKKGKPA